MLEKARDPNCNHEPGLACMIKYLNSCESDAGGFVYKPQICRSDSRCFLFILNKMEDIEQVANILLHEDTRSTIAYNTKNDGQGCVTMEKMSNANMYTFRLPNNINNNGARLPNSINNDGAMFIMMIVLPIATVVSTRKVFKSLKNITPVGCDLSADVAKAITKTGWYSTKTSPIDNWGRWRHIGMGKNADLHPFLMRCSVGQAKTI
jgi:hypothetical protein